MRPRVRIAAAALTLGVLGASWPAAAQSVSCGPEPVTARGEVSRYVWLAKTKARANWRARVRKTPGLGEPYSNWARATNTEERCLSGPAGAVCTMTGTPCR